MFGSRKKAPEEETPNPPITPTFSQPLADPGPPIVLVLKTYIDGTSNIQYKGDPAWAVETLRNVADDIEREVRG